MSSERFRTAASLPASWAREPALVPGLKVAGAEDQETIRGETESSSESPIKRPLAPASVSGASDPGRAAYQRGAGRAPLSRLGL